jgi:hypothetical protein
MKALVALAVALVMIGGGAAFALEYPLWQTAGQVSPDLVLAEREAALVVPSDAYAPYTPTARYVFGAAIGQVPPERALASRLGPSSLHLVAYLPYTERADYAPWCVCEQISPDHVLAERIACGICTQ